VALLGWFTRILLGWFPRILLDLELSVENPSRSRGRCQGDIVHWIVNWMIRTPSTFLDGRHDFGAMILRDKKGSSIFRGRPGYLVN
jgi:hypothetical protein